MAQVQPSVRAREVTQFSATNPPSQNISRRQRLKSESKKNQSQTTSRRDNGSHSTQRDDLLSTISSPNISAERRVEGSVAVTPTDVASPILATESNIPRRSPATIVSSAAIPKASVNHGNDVMPRSTQRKSIPQIEGTRPTASTSASASHPITVKSSPELKEPVPKSVAKCSSSLFTAGLSVESFTTLTAQSQKIKGPTDNFFASSAAASENSAVPDSAVPSLAVKSEPRSLIKVGSFAPKSPSPTPLKFKSFPMKKIPAEEKFRASISYIDSIFNFSIQLPISYNFLEAPLPGKIDKDKTLKPGHVRNGYTCLAKYKSEFYRAVITEVLGDEKHNDGSGSRGGGNRVKVAFVDYGNEEVVNLQASPPEVIQIPPECLIKEPCAFRCSLGHINFKEFRAKVINELTTFFEDLACLENNNECTIKVANVANRRGGNDPLIIGDVFIKEKSVINSLKVAGMLIVGCYRYHLGNKNSPNNSTKKKNFS